ncbi:MAG: hypothetical protein WC938_00645 [Candidatus Paceibacterota bacterium]|jgi:hypothetical protein
MEKVAVTKPIVNQWINYLRMKPDEQDEFLKKLVNQGRLSRTPKGSWLVFSGDDYGAIFNPSFTDNTISYFVSEKDATDFIAAMRERSNENFLHYRLCNGGCNH